MLKKRDELRPNGQLPQPFYELVEIDRLVMKPAAPNSLARRRRPVSP
jgi:hypothetical protein